MNTAGQDDHKTAYTTLPRVQAWFLKRSRDNWKKKYMELKADEKRLHNRVNDVSKSREEWREEAKQLTQRVQGLEAENTALQEQLAALKKDGPHPATGRAR